MAGDLQSERILAHRPLSVVVPRIAPSAPERVPPGTEFEVHWQGPDPMRLDSAVRPTPVLGDEDGAVVQQR